MSQTYSVWQNNADYVSIIRGGTYYGDNDMQDLPTYNDPYTDSESGLTFYAGEKMHEQFYTEYYEICWY